MVRPNRIKTVLFNGSPDMFSNAGGILSDVYSDNPINGTVHKIEYIPDGTNVYATTGSLWIQVSGTNEQISQNNGGLNVDFQQYPFVYGSDSSAVTGSPQVFTNFVVADKLVVAGSGLGNTKTGQVVVYYT